MFVNVNKFSLHAANRDRLTRAYLGASNPQRRANPFTGFDQRDDLQIHELLAPALTVDDLEDAPFEDFVRWLIPPKQRPASKLCKIKSLPPSKLARFLWDEFADSTRQQLLRYNGGDGKLALKTCLVQELNRLLYGELLIELQLPQLKRWERKIVNWFYLSKHAVGVFSPTQIKEFWEELDKTEAELDKKERARFVRDIPLFGGLPGGWQLLRPAPVKRFWLNRRVLEKFCRATANTARPTDRVFIKPCKRASGPQMCLIEKPEARPFHVVNMALNLVNGKELAWQERKARSFFATPLHVGASGVGLRPAEEYGMSFDGKGALTLGTALAISGAAANPNAGYHSSPLVTFFLTLFNVRMGWWLGNPGVAGAHTYRTSSPFFAPNMLLAETFGLTDDQHSYINVSDGGHFDNLGIYEMVRRRCHFILVSDAGQDEKYAYGDLGIAIRLIKADLGVPIYFKTPLPSGSPTVDTAKRVAANQEYCAIAEIDYKAKDGKHAVNGVLVLVKPAIYGGEPTDIYSYALSNPAFPNDSTFTDQFFSESQFESYRHLGEFTLQRVVEKLKGGKARDFSLAHLEQQARLVADRQFDQFSTAQRGTTGMAQGHRERARARFGRHVHRTR